MNETKILPCNNKTSTTIKSDLVSNSVYDTPEWRKLDKEHRDLHIQMGLEHLRAESLAAGISAERDMLETVMENTQTQIAYLDINFNFIMVNSAYAKGSGYDKAFLISKNHFELFPNKENQEIFEKVIKTGKSAQFKSKPFIFSGQAERGTTYWDWALVPVKNAQKKVVGLVFSLHDVTDEVKSDQEREGLLLKIDQERLRAEKFAAEAQDQADELNAVIHSMNDALLVYDQDGKLIKANPATKRMFGYDVLGETRESMIEHLQLRNMQNYLLFIS